MSVDPYQAAYNNALQRCTNPKVVSYHRYGGRGIEFRFKSLEDFRAAVGPRPDGVCRLDRINNDGHYEPGNVRWVTPSQSSFNRARRHQRGYIYEASGAFHVRYYTTEIVEGKPVKKQRSHRLCTKDRNTGHGSPSAMAVRSLCEDFMRTINERERNPQSLAQDLMVVDFWERVYFPYCEKEWKGTGMRASTLRGYAQVWKQHLKPHFEPHTLQGYTPDIARKFLSSLKTKHSKNILKHIRALASAMFSEAIERGLRNDNPWRVKLPKDCKETKATEHYTMEEAENLISALVEHVDAQLVIALSCFLGLGPAEIAGLQWGDVDKDWIHIRRNKPSNGKVGPPKTAERMAPVPIIDQVRVPLELWREKCIDTGDAAWMIVDLPNLLNRVILPHVKGEKECVRCGKTPNASGVTWKGLYAGRRGACTAIIEATNGNFAVAQAVLRHKTMDTTLRVYKKQITPQGLVAGMKQFQKALSGKVEN
jgi:integrase